jgi:hypothetical protein
MSKVGGSHLPLCPSRISLGHGLRQELLRKITSSAATSVWSSWNDGRTPSTAASPGRRGIDIGRCSCRSISVTDQKDAPERHRETLTCIERREQVGAFSIGANCDLPTPADVAIRDRQMQDQELRVQDEPRADDVPIGGVASRSPARLDFDNYSVSVVECVDLVGHLRVPVAAEENQDA